MLIRVQGVAEAKATVAGRRDETTTMGSLPNLNELSQEKEVRRALEKKRVVAREWTRQHEFSRDTADAKECLPMLNQVMR